MINKTSKNETRQKRHARVRAKISGTSTCPRLNVYRSNSHIFAQIIDDTTGTTLVSSSTLALKLESSSNVDAATKVGTDIAKKALEKNITNVVFDRGGYVYHGRVKALAEAAREAGLNF